MTRSSPPLNARKSPRQSRSGHTCAAIEEAAARILEEEGLPALTTNRIAERAGVSIGSLYQYYPGKEAIVAALLRAKRRALLAGLTQAAEQEAPLDSLIDALLDAALAHQFARPRLALALEYAEHLLPLDAETRALKAELAQAVEGAFRRHGLADPATTARDCVALARGIIDSAALAGEQDAKGLRKRVRRAVKGYLAAE